MLHAIRYRSLIFKTAKMKLLKMNYVVLSWKKSIVVSVYLLGVAIFWFLVNGEDYLTDFTCGSGVMTYPDSCEIKTIYLMLRF